MHTACSYGCDVCTCVTHVLCRLVWHCHASEVGEILWELHSTMQHARSTLMYNTLMKRRMGSTSLAGNITLKNCQDFCKCCPCTNLSHDKRQRTVQSIKSSQCMERLQADCITIKWRRK
jgi:hypothetical protein